VFDKYMLRFGYGGAEGYTHDPVDYDANVTVELEPGNWTVHADAYVDGTAVGTGSSQIEVRAGIVMPVTIRITTIKTGTGVKGRLKYTVHYTATDGDHQYTTPMRCWCTRLKNSSMERTRTSAMSSCKERCGP
jgi:hypothetical protein